jgi:hypothetical protein
MATMAREAWTDGRLDDLTKRVDDGFERNDGQFVELRREMNGRFNAVDARFDRLQQTIILGFGAIVASICGSAVAAILANQL